MGLESFKTEGPRTYKKDNSSDYVSAEDAIHLVKGMDKPDHDALEGLESHTVFKVPDTSKLTIPSDPPYFICEDCGRVASSFESSIKKDVLEIDEDCDPSELIDELKVSFALVDDSEFEMEPFDSSRRNKIEETNEDGNDTSSSTSSSSEDDRNFNSGLGSFTS